MKRILMSLMMIALVGTLAVGSTRAWYVGNDTETNNTFASAGAIKFDIRGHGTDFPTDGVPVVATNMLPGESNKDTTYFEVYNHSNSSTPIKYRLHAQLTSGSGSLYNKIKYRLYKCPHPVSAPVLCSGGNWQLRKSGWLKDLNGAGSNYAVPDPNLLGSVSHPEGSHRWMLELWLDSSAGNSYQSLSSVFNIIGIGTQPENPGWSE